MLKCRLKPEPFLTLLKKHNMSIRMFAREEMISDAAIVLALQQKRFVGPKLREAIQEGTGLAWDALFEIVHEEKGERHEPDSF